MPLTLGPRLRAFLEEPAPISIGTSRRDGSVQMTPIWFEYRDGQIWLNGGPNRDWFKHLKRDPRITLLLVDPKNMFRWVQIQGRLSDASFEGADDHIDHLSMRYNGRPYPAPKVERMIVRIELERVTGGENRQPWDVGD
jgi:PPOX class probable F420-dependent enzyme